MKKILNIIIFLFCMVFINVGVSASEVENISADEALAKLKVGNNRFVRMKLEHPDTTARRRVELLKGQHPFVVIISCSDSRVPPELIFDQGLGDIFEIRNAGNVLDKQVIGSVEYAMVHLGVKLVVVMGHQDCGAVTATANNVSESEFLESLTEYIAPSVEKAKKQRGNIIDNAVKYNAKNVVEGLIKSDPIIKKYVEEKGVKIIPAYYSLNSGRVEFYK